MSYCRYAADLLGKRTECAAGTQRGRLSLAEIKDHQE
jgi:hypothetical protein